MNVHLMRAFPDGDEGGNPAAVVLDAEDIAAPERQAIAARLAVSETAFVSRAEGHTVRVEFFTPTRQIAHCGHATVAAFALLRELGRIDDGMHSKLSVEGPRQVLVADGLVWLAQRPPSITPAADAAAPLAAALGLESPDSLAGPPVVVDVGNRFVHAALHSAATLGRVVPDQAALTALSEALDLVGVYLAAPDAARPERHATTRMFAPRYGIPEEAATGMAAGGLGALLAVRTDSATGDFLFEQGNLMPDPSPSLLRVRVRGTRAIESVWTGGSALRVASA